MLNTTTSSPPVLPPVAVVNDTNKGGLIAVIGGLFLSLIVVSYVTRIFIRTKVNGPWRRDDDCVTGATLVACFQYAVLFAQIEAGYGKTKALLEIDDLELIGKEMYASNVLYITALAFSKCAVCCLFLRLTQERQHAIASWLTIFASILWAMLSILLITIHCSPAHPWSDTQAQCSNIFIRWKVISALDIIIEIILFAIPTWFVSGLKMSLQLKSLVLGAFAFRLPVIAISAIRTHFLGTEISSPDPTLNGVYTAVCTEIQLGYAIIACTVSCLGPFLSPFSQELVHTTASRSGYSLSGHSRSALKDSHVSREVSIDLPTLRRDAFHRSQNIHEEPQSSRPSLDTNDSRRVIIQKKIEWSVERGDLRTSALS